ncbi:hypothetical protein Golax_004563 [Gossypium laxum]|uniref:Uncharacterized protein n=1 Tax=Gossypium laxum TaxID=34288 RepID=A0A7J9B327_9ROSI|nr:hypothetical protein [Gossypium laxum]
MTVAESMVKLGLGKDKLGSSKFEEMGVHKKDHNEDNDGNGIDDNGGNEKPRVRKKKPNRKRDKLKCFLCDGPYMLKKCLKKFALKEKSVGKALLRKCSRKFVIERDDGAEKEPKKIGLTVVKENATSELGESSAGLPPKENVSLSLNLGEKVTMKTVKLGPMRLNLSETSKLAESSTRLPPIGEVGDASNFKEKEVKQVG